MALNTLTATTQAVAVNYSYTTSGSTDWSGVTNNSYFYDLVTKLPYFKNNVGDIYHIFSGSTTGTTSNYTTGFTYSNNNLTISRNQGQPDLTVNVNTMTGLTINGNLSVTGNTSIKGLTGTSATISGSGQNILTLVGSGSTSPLFKISGSTNELFSVTDSTTGLLLTVNNNIGLPIFQTWDDFRVVMGSNATPGLTVSGSTVFVGPTATTTSKLYISTGTLQYNYGSLASGYILTSDSNGVATWQAPAGFNGGTVTGATIFNGGLSANTISATTYQNLPTNVLSQSYSGSTNITTISGNSSIAAIVISGSGTIGGTGYTDFIRVTNTAAGVTNPNKTFRINNTGDIEIIDSTYINNIFTLTNAGVLSTPGGGTSDMRTKSNIEYLSEDVLPTLMELKPVKFEFNNNKGVTRHGFIAQDVLNIKKDLVLGDGDKEDGIYGLDYDGILALTVKSLQEANKKIDNLEQIILELKNKINNI